LYFCEAASSQDFCSQLMDAVSASGLLLLSKRYSRTANLFRYLDWHQGDLDLIVNLVVLPMSVTAAPPLPASSPSPAALNIICRLIAYDKKQRLATLFFRQFSAGAVVNADGIVVHTTGACPFGLSIDQVVNIQTGVFIDFLLTRGTDVAQLCVAASSSADLRAASPAALSVVIRRDLSIPLLLHRGLVFFL
jgi:hypothetical protein